MTSIFDFRPCVVDNPEPGDEELSLRDMVKRYYMRFVPSLFSEETCDKYVAKYFEEIEKEYLSVHTN